METTLKSSPGRLVCRCGLDLRHALPAVGIRRAARQLRLCESVSLGEKRVVAVIQYEGQKFLVGGGAHRRESAGAFGRRA